MIDAGRKDPKEEIRKERRTREENLRTRTERICARSVSDDGGLVDLTDTRLLSLRTSDEVIRLMFTLSTMTVGKTAHGEKKFR